MKQVERRKEQGEWSRQKRTGRMEKTEKNKANGKKNGAGEGMG